MTLNQDPEKVGEVTHHDMDETSKSRGTDDGEFTAHDDKDKPHLVKGDDSDGRVEWTIRQILATFSLSALYVGMFFCYLFRLCMSGNKRGTDWVGEQDPSCPSCSGQGVFHLLSKTLEARKSNPGSPLHIR